MSIQVTIIGYEVDGDYLSVEADPSGWLLNWPQSSNITEQMEGSVSGLFPDIAGYLIANHPNPSSLIGATIHFDPTQTETILWVEYPE